MREEPGTVLIVDDDEDILTAGRLLLRRHAFKVICCRVPEQIPELLEQNEVESVLLDMNFGPGESSGQQGLDWLERILAFDPRIVVVMITAHSSVDTAVEAIKRGATDFVEKPWHNDKVVATMHAAVELNRSRIEAESLRQTNRVLLESVSSSSSSIIGDSPQMKEVLSLLERVAPTDANVMILGENGTGKELIARELHRKSARSGRAFLAVDLGSISESLFESELFGHCKGAFTGAGEARPGRFQAANGGTLLLDELGNLPLHLQAKLLGVLESRKVTPLGADKAETVDVRIVSATNMAAEALRDANRFRPDLLFRLNTVEITLPPLRERRSDILPIARHYLARYLRKYAKPDKDFSPAAESALREDDWPGNVRALRHAVERAVILAPRDRIEPADLQLADKSAGEQQLVSEPAYGPIPAMTLEQLEKGAIEKVLRKHGFNISHAAKELGLTRASLYRRMEKHGL